MFSLNCDVVAELRALFFETAEVIKILHGQPDGICSYHPLVNTMAIGLLRILRW